MKRPGPLEFLPARYPPLLYFGFAHVCLAAAFAATALDPRGVGGFFYHPRMLAVVHLVTLGWISGSILGSIYIVGPLALRFPMPAGRLDHAAFGSFAVGVMGMVSHFWIDHPPGIAWSAGLVTLPVALAFVNVLLVAGLGLLLAVNKSEPFLPFGQLAGAVAHAHLAVLGFAAMMVMGAGYRLIPMILPAAMPKSFWSYASAVLLQSGALGLTAAILAGRLVVEGATLAAVGLLAFFARLAWILSHPRPAPKELPRPDVGVLHVLQSLVYLALATLAGLALVLAPEADSALAVAMAYGVFGLVGFLAQIVVGIESRLLPLAAWLWSFAGGGYQETPPSLYGTPKRSLQVASLALWTAAVPLLATGLARDYDRATRAGAGLLFVAVVGNAVNAGIVLAHSRRRRSA